MQSGPSREIQEVASQAAACTPRPSSLLSVIVVHGARDPYVGTINADRTFQVFSELNSIFFIGSGGTQDQISQTKSSLPASNGHYSAQITETQFKGKTFVKEIMVEQMGHGWSGGQVTVPYMEPKGIDASQLIGDEFFR
jgi:poly(3-hydroxybutyrate) depolymerase